MVNVPMHTRFRRAFNRGLTRFLSLFVPRKAQESIIDPNTVRRILIVRPNYRIGNMLFLTPLINAIADRIPDAKVDLLVGMRSAGSILEPLPNVGHVYDIPRKLLRQPVKLLHFIRMMRSQPYDVVINLMPSSSSSQIVTLLAKGRYKASFYDENSWCPLTHVVPFEFLNLHMALRPLEILHLFGFSEADAVKALDIKLTETEKASGNEKLQALLKRQGVDSEKSLVVGLFRNARFDKRIPDEWWQQWYDALKKTDPSVVVIDILSPDVPEKLNDEVISYTEKDLRSLGAFLAAMDAFVCADTGPLHLAAASGATTLALFNKTEVEVYGALGEQNLTIDMDGLTVDEIVRRQLQHISRVRKA